MVFARGLKTNILITLAALLAIAILLTDLVLTMKAQQDLIQAEGEKGLVLLSDLEKVIDAGLPGEHFLRRSERDGFSCALLRSAEGGRLLEPAGACDYVKEMDALVRESLQTGSRRIKPAGVTWGVFGRQPHALLVAAPLLDERRIVGAAGVAVALEGVYRTLRQSQQILVFYGLLNLILLSGAGLYRLSKAYLQPIRRLVNRAEEYREDDPEILFAVRKGDNELKKLSSALNRMLRRIAADKERLQATVASLEKANLDLQQAQSEIIRAEKLAAVGRLSAGIAHEIGNPIGIVVGYLDLLKQTDLGTAEKNDYLVRAENEIGRIHTIIRQLLDVARPAPKTSADISVHRLIEDMAEMLKVQPLMSKVPLNLRLSAPRDVIRADADQIRQVFLNLAINATDALASLENKRDGCLTIRTAVLPASAPGALRGRETLAIAFEDNGPGIAPENMGNIFDPFFSTKDPGKGTGLGLSVSYMIVDGLGGAIRAESRPGEGTTMTVYLPFGNDEGMTRE